MPASDPVLGSNLRIFCNVNFDPGLCIYSQQQTRKNEYPKKRVFKHIASRGVSTRRYHALANEQSFCAVEVLSPQMSQLGPKTRIASRAPSGHATVVPPSSVMNSRRFSRSNCIRSLAARAAIKCYRIFENWSAGRTTLKPSPDRPLILQDPPSSRTCLRGRPCHVWTAPAVQGKRI